MYIPLVTDIFAYIMKFIMLFVTSNFGVAILLFTVITKLLMFPLQLKSKKGMIDQQRIAPKMAALEKKYKGNKQKYSEEVQKLYKAEGVSMLGGCLPTLLVLVVILGLYGVVYKPVTYLMNEKGNVETITQSVINLYTIDVTDPETGEAVPTLPDDTPADVLRINAQLRDRGSVDELNLAQALTEERIERLNAENENVYGSLFHIDLDFLGLDLGEKPSYKPINLQAILPVLSALTAFAMSWVTQKINTKFMPKNPAVQQANSTTKMMTYMMPVMSLVIGFALPAGLTLYWILNNVLSGVQEPILMKVALKKYGKGIVQPDAKKGKPDVETTATVVDEAPADTKEEDENK